MTLHRKFRWILLATLAFATACGSSGGGGGLVGSSGSNAGSGPGSGSGSGSGAISADPAKLNSTAKNVCGLLGKDVLDRHVPSPEKSDDPNAYTSTSKSAMGRCEWNSPGEYPQRTVHVAVEGYTDEGDQPGIEDAATSYEIEKQSDQSKAGKRMQDTAGLYTYSVLEDVAVGDGGYALAHTLTGTRAKSTTALIAFHAGPYFVRVTYVGYDLKKGGDATVPADRNLLPEAEVFAGAQALAKSVAASLAE